MCRVSEQLFLSLTFPIFIFSADLFVSVRACLQYLSSRFLFHSFSLSLSFLLFVFLIFFSRSLSFSPCFFIVFVSVSQFIFFYWSLLFLSLLSLCLSFLSRLTPITNEDFLSWVQISFRASCFFLGMWHLYRRAAALP